jgi:hypothetical protein
MSRSESSPNCHLQPLWDSASNIQSFSDPAGSAAQEPYTTAFFQPEGCAHFPGYAWICSVCGVVAEMISNAYPGTQFKNTKARPDQFPAGLLDLQTKVLPSSETSFPKLSRNTTLVLGLNEDKVVGLYTTFG